MKYKKNPYDSRTTLRYGIRKFSGIGLASALFGVGLIQPTPVNAASTDAATIQYHYVTTDELTDEEKTQIIKELPKEVTADATYYLVYQSNANQVLPKTNVQSKLLLYV